MCVSARQDYWGRIWVSELLFRCYWVYSWMWLFFFALCPLHTDNHSAYSLRWSWLLVRHRTSSETDERRKIIYDLASFLFRIRAAFPSTHHLSYSVFSDHFYWFKHGPSQTNHLHFFIPCGLGIWMIDAISIDFFPDIVFFKWIADLSPCYMKYRLRTFNLHGTQCAVTWHHSHLIDYLKLLVINTVERCSFEPRKNDTILFAGAK
jgi:hypothetical protein